MVADAMRASSDILSGPAHARSRHGRIRSRRALLGIVHSAVVDRPALNGPGLVDEVTHLVVRFLAP